MSFATILPLIFGVSFQTPLIMLFLERIHIFTVDDFRAKRKMSILVITIAAAVLTPGQDPFSMLLLAIPMILLYELGIVMIGRNRSAESEAGWSG
jgi:sec-independent protein translocase protein TatC